MVDSSARTGWGVIHTLEVHINATYGQVVLCITLETCQNLFIRYRIHIERPSLTTSTPSSVLGLSESLFRQYLSCE